MRPSTPSHFRVVHWNPARRSTTVEEFMMRPTFDPEAERIAADLLADIRARGEAAILAAMARIDGVTVHPTELRVSAKEFDAAEDRLAPAVKGSILEAHNRVADFARRSMRPDWEAETPHGGRLGERFAPLSRVGVYVPGGTAAYPSTVIMDTVPAKLAGVGEVVMMTPPGKDGRIPDAILAAAKLCGVDRVFRSGGAQAIAALAYGTKTVPAVDKIVGPGNAYVAEAKRQVSGDVGIDMIAGPSEVLVISDGSTDPRVLAADMLSQAEHDVSSSAVLITVSQSQAEKVAVCLEEQIPLLPRRDIARRSIDENGRIIVTETVDEAVRISNAIAPEHLELCVEDPFAILDGIKCAGSVFLGGNCPEPLGDYLAGPNHTLPTGGTARFSSPLSVDDFVKRIQYSFFTEEALDAYKDDVAYFAETEGLAAHAKSALIRNEIK